jgi:cell division transport system permease protein
MSRWSDDPRARPPQPGAQPPNGQPPPPGAPTQRMPNGYTPSTAPVVPPPAPAYAPAPPPPPRDQRDQRNTPAFDFEPTPLRSRRAIPSDITPPVDPLEDAYREVMTGQPTDTQRRQADSATRVQQPQVPVTPQAGQSKPAPPPMPTPRDEMADDLYADSRHGTSVKDSGGTAIVPPKSVTGKSLVLVIAIMCFLACLTAGAVYLMNQSARAWLKDIASEVTVQVEAREKVDLDREVARLVQLLQKQPGLKTVRAFTPEENAKLLEPWLGQADLSKSASFQLPVPRLIALEIDRTAPPNFEALRAMFAKDFKGVTLDDHRHWQQQIRTVTRSFALGGLAILMLVGAATTAIIVSATRSALSANKEIVEVLHFVGATDRFIAREFAGHFLRLGVRAGVVGAGSAMACFFALPFVMDLVGGGTITGAEVRRLIGTGSLDLPGYGLLFVVVIVVAALCMFTSRIGVYRILNAGPENGTAAPRRRI